MTVDTSLPGGGATPSPAELGPRFRAKAKLSPGIDDVNGALLEVDLRGGS